MTVITQAVTCVGIGIGLFTWPQLDPEASLSPSFQVRSSLEYDCLSHCRDLSIHPQIQMVTIVKDLGSTSIPLLILQVVFFSVDVSRH